MDGGGRESFIVAKRRERRDARSGGLNRKGQRTGFYFTFSTGGQKLEVYSKMAKALHKVQKQISRKRGGKPTSLHENSRDSRRLRTAGAREDKLAKLVAAATKANQVYGQRIVHFLLLLH